MKKIATKVMQLTFFANRFGIDKKLLKWGLLVSQNEDAEVDISPVVIVKGKNLIIDIKNDILSPVICCCGCLCTTYIAELKKEAGGYQFSAGDEKTFLANEEIAKRYHGKFLTEELEKDAELFK